MRVPDTSTLLQIWESGHRSGPDRLLDLVAHTWPGDDDVASLTVGATNAHLVDVRRHLFGTDAQCVDRCPSCGQDCELTFPLDRLAPAPPQGRVEISLDGWSMQVRPPRLADLLDAGGAGRSAPVRFLLDRCLSDVRLDGVAVTAGEIPEVVIGMISETLAEADPCGDVEIRIHCPECGHEWLVPFDIETVLWADLDAWSLRVLADVQRLAAAYGWREPDVLALSPLRRKLYVEALPT